MPTTSLPSHQPAADLYRKLEVLHIKSEANAELKIGLPEVDIRIVRKASEWPFDIVECCAPSAGWIAPLRLEVETERSEHLELLVDTQGHLARYQSEETPLVYRIVDDSSEAARICAEANRILAHIVP